jgi:hypothetical protein
MKDTKTKKKMNLNKTTVSNLKVDDLQKMRGGADSYYCDTIYCTPWPQTTMFRCCWLT